MRCTVLDMDIIQYTESLHIGFGAGAGPEAGAFVSWSQKGGEFGLVPSVGRAIGVGFERPYGDGVELQAVAEAV